MKSEIQTSFRKQGLRWGIGLTSALLMASLSQAWDMASCSKSNGRAYCNAKEHAERSYGSNDRNVQEFGKLVNQSVGALDELLTGKKQSTAEWLAEREAYNAAVAAQNSKIKELVKTREGRRTYYGTLKGKGDGQMDYWYAGTLDDEKEHLKWMRSAASLGYPNAMYAIALYTERGLWGIPVDLPASQKLMESAAAKGQLTAKSILASRLAFGDARFGIQPNPALAFPIAVAACDMGNAHACVTLADLFRHGTGVAKDTEKAVALYTKVVLQDEAPNKGVDNLSFENEKSMAAYSLADIYALGEGAVAADKDSARTYLLLSVNQPGLRITEAWIAFGDALLVPQSRFALPERDVKRGLEVFQWFANINYTPAMDILGNLYLYGKYGVPKDQPLGLSWLKKAASLNNQSAMLRLAGYYADSEPQGKEVQAFQWVKMAADAGSAQGNWLLAMHYYRGMGVPTDDAKFKAALIKACELNSADGCFEMGKRYLGDADGIFEKNIDRGRTALASASKEGKADASFWLATSYLGDANMTPNTALLGVQYAASAVKSKVKGADEYWQKIGGTNNALVQAALKQMGAR